MISERFLTSFQRKMTLKIFMNFTFKEVLFKIEKQCMNYIISRISSEIHLILDSINTFEPIKLCKWYSLNQIHMQRVCSFLLEITHSYGCDLAYFV